MHIEFLLTNGEAIDGEISLDRAELTKALTDDVPGYGDYHRPGWVAVRTGGNTCINVRLAHVSTWWVRQ